MEDHQHFVLWCPTYSEERKHNLCYNNHTYRIKIFENYSKNGHLANLASRVYFKFSICHLAVPNEHLEHAHRSAHQLNGWFGSVVSRQELDQQQHCYFVVLWSIFTFGVLVKTF